jgi:quercetin dioxygenase-like cupin family protein
LAALAGVLGGAAPFDVAQGRGAQSPSALVFHDLAAMARWPFGGMQANGAMGQHASMFIATVPPGGRTTPHHHHQEQFMFGLEGALSFVLAGSSPQPLTPRSAAFAPANVLHGNVNGDAPAKYIEFQAVLRPDWYPPHPRRPREGTPEPQPIPQGRKVSENFTSASDGWRSYSGARAKALAGNTASVTVWEVPGGGTSVDLSAGPAAERFVYVIDGAVTVTEGKTSREAGREMLIIVSPAAREVRATARQGTAVLAVFAAHRP